MLAAPTCAVADPPVPYWASLHADTVNMRVGPGEDYRIAWVFHRHHLPVKVIRTVESWRLVQDSQGSRGWIMARFLSRERDGVITGKGAAQMHDQPGADGRLLWKLTPGVLGRLGDCDGGWCKLDVDGHAGFVEQIRVWGAGAP